MTFRHIGLQGDLLSIKDYYSLVCLICHDFSYKILQKSVKIILMDDATDCLMSFADFIYAFQLQLYYDEFFVKCLEVFSTIQTQAHGSRVTGEPSEISESTAAAAATKTDSISSKHYFHRIKKEFYIKTAEFSVPEETILYEILSTVSRVIFYGFMMSLTKSQGLCKAICALPVRPVSALHGT